MKTIRGIRWYKPREIARLGLISNSKGANNEHANYVFVLELIRSSELRAKNYGKGKVPYWLVPSHEIEHYNDTITNLRSR